MATMLNVFDRATRKKTAVLQNAFNIVETQEINQIYSLTFTLPAADEKNAFCLPRHFVRYGENGELYRIKSPKVNDTSVGTIVYECEHVITTLCDDIMFGSYIYGGRGVPTSSTIGWVLSKQKTANWRLGRCDFARQFEYNWEQENLLNALYSIPKEFASAYMWTFDTQSYPWTMNLVEIDKTATPEYYLRAKSNILASGSSADYANICTRIYPLGYGEGVNQLTIKEATVNAQGDAVQTGGRRYGLTYIQSPQSYIDKYGIVEKVLVDRRFEQPNTLYGYAKSMLAVYQEPTMSRTFDVTDLYPLTNKPMDDAQIGKICKLTQDNSIAYITKTQRRWDLAGDLHIDLSTKASDIASNVADLADRIRIESVYSQGATQLYQHSKDANATKDKGMVISLYFPTEMKQINKVLLRLKLGKFRSYSQATDSKTVTVKTFENKVVTVKTNEIKLNDITTTKAGGGTTSVEGSATVTVGGGSTTSGKNTSENPVSVDFSASAVSYAPQTTTTSAPSTDTTSGTQWAGDNSMFYTVPAGGDLLALKTSSDSFPDHTHTVSYRGWQFSMYKSTFSHSHNINHYHKVDISGTASGGKHQHSFTLPSHSHTITAHSHNLPSLSHSHNITLNGHTHDVTLNSHSHSITAGIFESGNPTAFDIYVGGTIRATIETTQYNGDITEWLLNSSGLIPRGSWIDIEIRPNDLAYVTTSVFVQGFVQSRGGGNY